MAQTTSQATPMRIQAAPTVAITEATAATLSAIVYVGEGARPLPTLTLWSAARITWQSWRPHWK